MPDVTIASVLIRQLARECDMLRDTIRQFPADQWRSGDMDHLVPARQALHIIETVEFYSGDTREGFPWGHRFGVDWEGAPAEQLPAQEDVLAYLDDVQARAEVRLRGAGDHDLLSTDPAFPWTGGCILDRALYVLRHTHHHLGEMAAELRRRNLPRPEWR